MDRKSIAILVGCFLLILCWTPLMQKFYPPPPHSTNVVAQVAAPATSQTTTTSVSPSGTTFPNVESKLLVRTNLPEELLTISNADTRYTFTSRGGGLQDVQLLHYPAAVSSRRTRKHDTNDVATLNDSLLPPMYAIYGDDSLSGEASYKLTTTASGLRAEAAFTNGLAIIKDFELATNYLMYVSVRFENRSQKPLAVSPQAWVAGAATPMDPLDNGMAEAVFWHNGSKSQSVALQYFATNTSSMFGLFSRVPKTSYVAGSNDVAWVSAQNQFFTLATMPQKPAESLSVHMAMLPAPTAEEIAANPAVIRGPMAMEALMFYPGMTLASGQSVTNRLTLYAGPKKYETLAQLAARFNNDIDLIMSFGWVSPVSKALLVTMNWLHSSILLPYGWIIIGITFVIKMIFWPLTAASVRSSKRMQALQPQLKALQEKYKDDPQKATAKQWEFYKKNKVNPLSGCLPAFLQIPVFLGFYYMLRGAIELRGAPFLWIGDLSKQDTVYSILLPFHFLGYPDGFLPINPMPLIMGATLLWGASMAPPSPSMDPSQQKMMKYMPLFMLFFMYTQSSGLALYWTVSNLLTVVQNKLTRMGPTDTAAEPAKAVSVAPQKKKKD